MNEMEERLRREMTAATESVEAPGWLPGAAARGGRRRLRRRRVLLAVPVTVVAAGAVGVGALGPGGWPSTSAISALTPAAGAPAAAPTTTPKTASPVEATPDPQDAAALAAYFNAGYGWDEAVQLGQLWSVEPTEAKVTAGTDLRAGRTLPVSPAQTLPADPEAPQREAFFAAGYTMDDAVQLSELWNVEAYEAKITGGTQLLAGEELPIAPSAPGTNGATAGTSPEDLAQIQRDTFYAAGYDYRDAVQLGRQWNVEPAEAEAMGGDLLLAGARLPLQP